MLFGWKNENVLPGTVNGQPHTPLRPVLLAAKRTFPSSITTLHFVWEFEHIRHAIADLNIVVIINVYIYYGIYVYMCRPTV